MLKRLVNEARVPVVIENRGPLLIKSGFATVTGPDMAPVVVQRNNRYEEYIPGSSLKGALRSHFERVAASLAGGRDIVCDPFGRYERGRAPNNVSCGNRFQEEKKRHDSDKNACRPPNNEEAYRRSCPACRLFGSTWFIGRLSINDAYLAPESRARRERRDGVGIDRLTGGSSATAKFDLEVVGAGARFETEVQLRNFECWQLGALFMLLEDLRDGFIRLGSGRSRGLGDVACDYTRADVYRIGQTPAGVSDCQIPGLGCYLSDGAYGTEVDDLLDVGKDGMPDPEQCGVRSRRRFEGERLQRLRSLAVARFTSRIAAYDELERA